MTNAERSVPEAPAVTPQTDSERQLKRDKRRDNLISILVPLIVATLTGVGVVYAGSETGRGTIEAGNLAANANLTTADSNRQESAYVDFITTQKRYLIVCKQIVDALNAYATTAPQDLAKIRHELGASLVGWASNKLELIRSHSLVRLVDSIELDEKRAELEQNEEHIDDYLKGLGDPLDANTLKLPVDPKSIKRFSSMVEHHSDLITKFIDSASSEIKHTPK